MSIGGYIIQGIELRRCQMVSHFQSPLYFKQAGGSTMTKEQRRDWTAKTNEACDALLDVCDKIESDYLYNEVARLRYDALSIIDCKFGWEGKQ